MNLLNNLRLEFWKSRSSNMVTIRADCPSDSKISYICFVMMEAEFTAFATKSMMECRDGYHHLKSEGDIVTFYNWEYDTRENYGVLQVPYIKVEIPMFVRRLWLKIAKARWTAAKSDEEKSHLEISPERVKGWLRRYGCGAKVEQSLRWTITRKISFRGNFRSRLI